MEPKRLNLSSSMTTMTSLNKCRSTKHSKKKEKKKAENERKNIKKNWSDCGSRKRKYTNNKQQFINNRRQTSLWTWEMMLTPRDLTRLNKHSSRWKPQTNKSTSKAPSLPVKNSRTQILAVFQIMTTLNSTVRANQRRHCKASEETYRRAKHK